MPARVLTEPHEDWRPTPEHENPEMVLPPLVIPAHFRVVYRDASRGGWGFKSTEPFYNPRNIPINRDHLEESYGLTKGRVAIELFRLNGGKEGWYLANLRDRKYYYCGLTREDVREKLRSLLDIG